MSKSITESSEIEFIDFLYFFSLFILLLMSFFSYFVNDSIVCIIFLFLCKSVLIGLNSLRTFADDKIGKFGFINCR